uniref:SOS response-associated peptidase n=1 Tax=Alicyclobacillus tolerans TaxID=90970 RepID=UPI0027E01199|nr:SOS response-associated peptidase [Alicyclobacillus tolerans]
MNGFMCGRYTLAYEDWSFMLEYFGLAADSFFLPPRYNIAPGQMVPAVISDGKRRRIGLLKWGLIPHWAKDPKIANQTINARSETLLQRPAYQSLIQRKRCLLPADGFYEWKKNQHGKQPMRIVLTDRPVFAFAGLYDSWLSPSGEKVSTCTVITTGANELMAPIHHRMPVILNKESEAVWLDPDVRNTDQLLSLLQPYPHQAMRAYRVPAFVGSVKNDGPECIQELA